MKTSPTQAFRWLETSPDARRLLWHVFAIACGRIRQPQHIRALDKPGAQILWIEDGEGELRIGPHTYALRPGNKFWLYNAHDRIVGPKPGSSYVNFGICFGGPSLEAWLDRLDVDANAEFEFSPAQAARMKIGQRQLMRVIQRQGPDWEWEVHVRMNEILKPFLVARGLFGVGAQLPPPVMKVVHAVAADPARDWKTPDLAVLAGLSPTRLRIHFQSAMHETLHQYIQRSRLNLARQYLGNPALRIKQIAERLHFSNEYYFSTFFRKQTGWTPSEFREHQGVSWSQRTNENRASHHQPAHQGGVRAKVSAHHAAPGAADGPTS